MKELDPDKAFAARLRRTVFLAVSMGVLLVVSLVNRELPVRALRADALDILRVCDFTTLFLLAPVGIAIMWDFMGSVEAGSRRLLSLAFVLGVFFLGMGFGMHEPMNAMHIQFLNGSVPADAPIHRSVAFFDDALGHWIFFAGMLATICVLAVAETGKPFERALPWKALTLVALSGLAGAVSLFGNEVNDHDTGVDLLVVWLCVAAVLAGHWREGFASLKRLPFTLCFYIVFAGGGAATCLVWLVRATLRA